MAGYMKSDNFIVFRSRCIPGTVPIDIIPSDNEMNCFNAEKEIWSYWMEV